MSITPAAATVDTPHALTVVDHHHDHEEHDSAHLPFPVPPTAKSAKRYYVRKHPDDGPWIVWTIPEREAIARAAVAELRRNGICLVPEPRDRLGANMLMSAVRKAQLDVLPPERRRRAIYRQQLDQTKKGVSVVNAMARIFKEPPPPKPEVPEIPPPAPDQPDTAVATPDAPPPEAPPPAAHQPTNGHPHPAAALLPPPEAQPQASGPLGPLAQAALTLANLLQQFESRLAEQAEMQRMLIDESAESRKRLAAVAEQVEHQARELHALRSTSAPDASPIRKRSAAVVAIIGCRKDEFAALCSRAADRGLDHLDFRHYDQDSRPRPVAGCTHALLLKWTPSHAWQAHVDQTIPRSQSVYVAAGGIAKALLQLEVWFGADS